MLNVCLLTVFSHAGGLLSRAAEDLNDEEMLLLIRDQDCVSIEVRYHRTCFRNYTRKLSLPKKNLDMDSTNDSCYEVVFKSFCTSVIEDKVIRNGDIMRVSKLTSLLLAMLNEAKYDSTQGHIKNCYLKRKLKLVYPQLQFVRPSKKNLSELVFAEGVESILASTLESDSETDDDETCDEENSGISFIKEKNSPVDIEMETTRMSYLSALNIGHAISDVRGFEQYWPPTTVHYENSSWEAAIPVALYNTLAWMTGASDEICHDRFVSMSAENHQKLVSIVQDIIYFASKGRTQTPKHLSLGLTIRHWSGSSRLIELLSGFGHCVSHSVVLQYDTALAELQLNSSDIVPVGYTTQVPSIVIWDNNDFMEETSSGAGTTHNTNGILVQRTQSRDPYSSYAVSSLKKTKKRSIDAPSTDIERYYGKKRCGPNASNPTNVYEIEAICRPYQLLDLAFCFMKLSRVDYDLLPGWTGFNTLLQSSNVPPVSKIGYLPVIDASPTDLSTVYTILLRSVDIADRLQLESITVVFDQAIYAKAQQIR